MNGTRGSVGGRAVLAIVNDIVEAARGGALPPASTLLVSCVAGDAGGRDLVNTLHGLRLCLQGVFVNVLCSDIFAPLYSVCRFP